MTKRTTVASAHERIDGLEKEVIAIKTEVKIQFKDLFVLMLLFRLFVVPR